MQHIYLGQTKSSLLLILLNIIIPFVYLNERDTEISYWLVLFLKCLQQAGLARPKPRARDSIWVSHVGDQNQCRWVIICCLPWCAWSRKLDQEQNVWDSSHTLCAMRVTLRSNHCLRCLILLSLLINVLEPHRYLFVSMLSGLLLH